MRKPLVITVSILLLSIATVAGLFIGSQQTSKAIPGFKRTFVGIITRQTHTLDLGFNSYYLSGDDSSKVYLGNIRAARHVLEVDLNTLDTTVVGIRNLPIQEKLQLTLHVRPPQFILSSGSTPVVFTGNTTQWTIDSVNRSAAFFLNLVGISRYSSVTRIIDAKTDEYTLRKESTLQSETQSNNALLTKQVDGLFCKDGMLVFNYDKNLILYPYYYRNEIVVADTNLNLVRRIKTIDPIDSARFTVGTINAGTSITTSSPTLVVNNLMATSGDYVFINSGIRATNEAPTADNYGVPVDIYNLTSGAYLGSFYIPPFNKLKLNQLFIKGKTLIARHEKYLVRYELYGNGAFLNDR